MLKVKDSLCPVKMRNRWRNYATMILKMRVERVNLRNLGRRGYISQTKKWIKVNVRALLSSKHPSREAAHVSGIVSLMYQESGTLGTKIPNFTKKSHTSDVRWREALLEGWHHTHSGTVWITIGPITKYSVSDEVALATNNSKTFAQLCGMVIPQ